MSRRSFESHCASLTTMLMLSRFVNSRNESRFVIAIACAMEPELLQHLSKLAALGSISTSSCDRQRIFPEHRSEKHDCDTADSKLFDPTSKKAIGPSSPCQVCVLTDDPHIVPLHLCIVNGQFPKQLACRGSDLSILYPDPLPGFGPQIISLCPWYPVVSRGLTSHFAL